VGEWLVRWAAPTYDQAGDGNIFYVGMQAGSGGSPQFYDGTTCAVGTTHAKYFTYPTMRAVPGAVSGPTITWTVPLIDIGSPASGQGLFSITGFTATQGVPSSSSGTAGCNDDITGSGAPPVPNLIDAAPPFTFVVGTLAQAHGHVTARGG
jgi:hypothetical protein